MDGSSSNIDTLPLNSIRFWKFIEAYLDLKNGQLAKMDHMHNFSAIPDLLALSTIAARDDGEIMSMIKSAGSLGLPLLIEKGLNNGTTHPNGS